MLQSIILNSGILAYPDEFWSGMKPEDRAALRVEVMHDEPFWRSLDALASAPPREALKIIRRHEKHVAICKLEWFEGSHWLYGNPYDFIGAIPGDIVGIIRHYLGSGPGKALGIDHGYKVIRGPHDETRKWSRFDRLDRDDGPAYIYISNEIASFVWYRGGIRIRPGGPSMIQFFRMKNQYFADGFESRDERLVAEVAALLGERDLWDH